jgi:hypothetical protein
MDLQVNEILIDGSRLYAARRDLKDLACIEQTPIKSRHEFSHPHPIHVARKHAASGEIAIVGVSGY